MISLSALLFMKAVLGFAEQAAQSSQQNIWKKMFYTLIHTAINTNVIHLYLSFHQNH